MNIKRSFINITVVGLSSFFLLSCASSQTKHQQTLPLDKVKTEGQLNQHQSLALKGLNDLSSGKINKASHNFNDALRLSPADPNYHLLNAVTYHLEAINGNAASYELALQGYKVAQKFDPTNWLTFFSLDACMLNAMNFPLLNSSLLQH